MRAGGVIVDRLYSECEERYIYKVHIDGASRPSTVSFTDEMLLQEAPLPPYEVEVVIEENLVLLHLYKNGQEIRKTHAHILRSGDEGIAQAISYAGKRLLQSFGGLQKN